MDIIGQKTMQLISQNSPDISEYLMTCIQLSPSIAELVIPAIDISGHRKGLFGHLKVQNRQFKSLSY